MEAVHRLRAHRVEQLHGALAVLAERGRVRLQPLQDHLAALRDVAHHTFRGMVDHPKGLALDIALNVAHDWRQVGGDEEKAHRRLGVRPIRLRVRQLGHLQPDAPPVAVCGDEA